MKTILIPIDLSLHSYHTAHFGLELASKLGINVLLLHVAPPLPTAPILSIPTFESDNRRSSSYVQLTSDLQRFEDELNEYQREEGLDGIEIGSRMVVGQPAESILEAARTEHPAFVVMGMVGASNAWDKMVGSVSSAVAQEITRPLWILPGAVRLDNLRKFAYFAELAGKEVGCIDQVVDLGERLRAKLNVVHVASVDEENYLEAEAIMEIFEFCYANKRITFKNLMYDTLGEGIEAYVESRWPDVIVLAHRKRGMIARLFHSRTIRQLTLTTRLPLLIIQKKI
ncbi:MAG: universal stress protein [Bacteroidetes bacterium]|nr:universal stress protein [Bacteroidota bacterium]